MRAEAAFPGASGKIAFQSFRDGNAEIYTMNPDGSAQTNISNNAAIDVSPAWSADGSQIAFSSTRDGNLKIYKMNADGSGQTQLTTTELFDNFPAWTNDGRIVFSRGRGGPGGCGTEIYIMNADGTGETNITNSAAGDCLPSASVSGRIAFVSDRDGNAEIYTMNLDGSGVTRITNNTVFDGNANWSPDAARLAFIGDDINDIYVMQADGSGRTRLTDTPSGPESSPAWSPQGDKIAFSRAASADPGAPEDVYVMNSDGSGEVQLTTLDGANPDWQPTAVPASDVGVAGFRTHGRIDLSRCQSSGGGICTEGVVIKLKNFGATSTAVDFSVASNSPDADPDSDCLGTSPVLARNATYSPPGCEIVYTGTGMFAFTLGTTPTVGTDVNPSNNAVTLTVKVVP
jgi:Tol biopolymer transport system component